MEKRFNILIEDDWEIQGNGLGNVAQSQYLPSLFLMKAAKKLGIKLTFMVDVAQQLAYRKCESSDYNLSLQRNLWDDSVRLMKSYGFDVQLHLHPQWLSASPEGDYFKLGRNWNIGRYSNADQFHLIQDAIQYLKDLLLPIDPNYNVVAFKGGSWGLQPSEKLFRHLKQFGIHLVMGVRRGMHLPGNGVDYRDLVEEGGAYQPDFGNICQRASHQSGLYIIPLQSVSPGIRGMSYLVLDLMHRKFSRRDSVVKYYERTIPNDIIHLSPIARQSYPRFPYLNYQTHLKIGNQPYRYLKYSFDQVIARLLKKEESSLPIVIECHTKQFRGYYHDIERFLDYIVTRYDHLIEFNTMTQYWSKLQKMQTD